LFAIHRLEISHHTQKYTTNPIYKLTPEQSPVLSNRPTNDVTKAIAHATIWKKKGIIFFLLHNSTLFHRTQQRLAAILKEERAHAAHFALLFHKDFKVLINDGDGEEDTGATADGAEEIG